MEVLRLKYRHFTLTAETQRPEVPFTKAALRQSDITISTKYTVPTDAVLELWYADTNMLTEANASQLQHPAFFENRMYTFSIEFTEGVTEAKVLSRNKDWEDSFVFKKYGNVPLMMGSVNFGNDIGKHTFTIQYRFDNQLVDASLGFEVFPLKLDYKTDYRNIISDIQEAYPNLVLDFLRRTYQQFNSVSSGPTNDLIWWSIFERIFQELIQNLQYVVNNSHRRLQEEPEWVHPEKIRKATPLLEEQLRRYRHVSNRRYLLNRKVLRTDTFENRFVKAALIEVAHKFTRIKSFVIRLYGPKISNTYALQLLQMERRLSQLRNHPFFRDIGVFEGFKQESLVLQKKTGYSSIFRNWILLKKGYSFFEGASKLELKDIAELYQIWCFLEMKEMVASLLRKEPEQVELAELKVSEFRVHLREGKRSKISFVGNRGEEIELFHELQYLNEFDRQNKTGSYTSVQKPDIVLRIHKKDLLDNLVFTYLFDAKYRLSSDDDEKLPDAPPEDAINQMHRYRDAIYFNDQKGGYMAKEVIGGFILYPGRDDIENVRQNSHYYRSIEKVNIGAFPLLPGYQTRDHLLRQYLSSLLQADTIQLLQEAPPQRGKMYHPVNASVLLGMIAGERLLDYIGYFDNTEHPEVFFYKKPSLVFEGMVNFFAPYFKGRGIKSYYRITGYYITTRDRVYQNYPGLKKNDTSLVYVLSLSLMATWKEHYTLEDGNIRTFRYSKLSDLKNPLNGKIHTILKNSIRDQDL